MNILGEKIYLAGPDVFYPDAIDILAKKKELCKDYGFIPISPLDNEVDISKMSKSEAAGFIALANKNKIRDCDIIIANLNSFRGFEPDSGTCFEVGYGMALNKRIYIYLDSHIFPMRKRYPLYYGFKSHLEKDMEGNVIEDFNMPVNLMFSESKIFETFEDCLIDLKKNI